MKQQSLRIVTLVLLAAGLLAAAGSFIWNGGQSSLKPAARRIERGIERRSAELDRLVRRSAAGMLDERTALREDFVIYRYAADTLQQWLGRFPVMNDDISSAGSFQRFIRGQQYQRSPLLDASTEYSFKMMGGKPFVFRREDISGGSVKIFAGFGIENLARRYVISPSAVEGGVIVKVAGIPQFCISLPDEARNRNVSFPLYLLATLLFVAAALLWVGVGKRTLPRSLFGIGISFVSAFALSLVVPAHMPDSAIWRFLILSAALFLMVLFLYQARRDIWQRVEGRPSRHMLVIIMGLLALCVPWFIALSVRDIISATDVNLELYKINQLDLHSAMVLFSLVLLSLCMPMLLQLTGRFEAFSTRSRILFSLLCATVITLSAGHFGFGAEKIRVAGWADRLSAERNIPLERQLLNIENRIASDPLIALSLDMDNPSQMVASRIISSYLGQVAGAYDILISIGSEPQASEGEPIAPASRFHYSPAAGGQCRYRASFIYYGEFTGISNVTITLDPKAGMHRQGTGDNLAPRTSLVPPRYSFAKYEGMERQFYRGNYVYPSVLADNLYDPSFNSGRDFFEYGGYIHFFTRLDEGALMILSRPANSGYRVLVALILLSLMLFGASSLFRIGYGRANGRRSSYFRTRISAVVMFSLMLTLAALATVSVIFVYQRNEANSRKLLTEKMNTVRVMLDEELGNVASLDLLNRRDLFNSLRKVGDNTNSDLSIYRTDGRLYMTTTPMSYEKLSRSSRMEREPFEQIVHRHKGVAMSHSAAGSEHIHALYAPVTGPDGQLLAVASCLYSGGDFDFESDAVMHLATIMTVFLLLLLVAFFLTGKILDRMFAPLYDMGAKMVSADLDSLEYIEYDRKDEISSIVDSYNRMVRELGESTRKLAQAERDKAWSGMARQVAHEIKNPLTPMKLQIQRLIRLKQNGDPDWEEKFEKAAGVLLDHIDVLSDTANEFSTFAKLYTEEPVEIALDKLLKEEISLFESRPGSVIEYIGLEDVTVRGPKPQLTRVIVNLLSNAVQACEGAGGDVHVAVSLRRSSEEGYYDIVVEDCGPGVGEENVAKLFTPNFTTKSGGSGLGLAISRSILENCNATISYSRSLLLGGACFTIRYPA
ncbi:MAG: hypothetical protein KBS55_00930 [Bacteroidales bacterium]|nr:hypothetical protein [Candidatus Cryptobacteroides aphodequi]